MLTGGGEAGSVWGPGIHEISVPSSHFCCSKKVVYEKKVGEVCLILFLGGSKPGAWWVGGGTPAFPVKTQLGKPASVVGSADDFPCAHTGQF